MINGGFLMKKTTLLSSLLVISAIGISTNGLTQSIRWPLHPSRTDAITIEDRQDACRAFYRTILDGHVDMSPKLLFNCIEAPQSTNPLTSSDGCSQVPVPALWGMVLGHEGCYFKGNFGDCINPLYANGLLWAEKYQWGRSAEIDNKVISVLFKSRDDIQRLVSSCSTLQQPQLNPNDLQQDLQPKLQELPQIELNP